MVFVQGAAAVAYIGEVIRHPRTGTCGGGQHYATERLRRRLHREDCRMKALIGTVIAAVLTLGTDHFFGIVPAVFVLVLTASIVATITLDSPPTDN